MQKTIKIYDQDSHRTTCHSTVLSCEYDTDKHVYAVILDQTVFFPEGGGQFCDLGEINEAVVCDVQIKNDIITHYTKTALHVGETVFCKIDWKRRFDFMQQHSAEHIISGIVHQTYGYNNVGFHLGLTETTLDFDGPLTTEQIHTLELQANEAIYKNIAFQIVFPDAETLAQMDYRSKKELSGDVRIVILPEYDMCACCAPHVSHTGEIGIVKIVHAMAHRGGMRLTILCGARAIADYQAKQTSIEQISALLSAKQPEVACAVEKAKQDQQQLILRINELQKKVLESELKNLPSPDVTEDVFLFQKDLDTKAIRDAVNVLCTKYKGYCGIFVGDAQHGYTFVIGSAQKDCKKAADSLRSSFGAKGGGSAHMIQGNIAAEEADICAVLQGAFLE